MGRITKLLHLHLTDMKTYYEERLESMKPPKKGSAPRQEAPLICTKTPVNVSKNLIRPAGLFKRKVRKAA